MKKVDVRPLVDMIYEMAWKDCQKAHEEFSAQAITLQRQGIVGDKFQTHYSKAMKKYWQDSLRSEVVLETLEGQFADISARIYADKRRSGN